MTGQAINKNRFVYTLGRELRFLSTMFYFQRYVIPYINVIRHQQLTGIVLLLSDDYGDFL